VLDLTDPLLRALDLIGVATFAVSGALVAVRSRFDIVGMAVLATTTALGGGVVRDLIVGATPPAAFNDVVYLLVPLAVTVVVLLWHPVVERVTPALLFFDAAGLGLFCVVGAAKALAFGIGPFPAVLLGVTTAVGGGVLRDLLAGEVPTVFRNGAEFYAVPAMVGASAVVLADSMGVLSTFTAFGAALLAFGLRLLALRFGWRAPAARGAGRHLAASGDRSIGE
jgi:uncharacterized membrane protein YeiH